MSGVPSWHDDLSSMRRGLIAARDFLNRLPINDGASKQAIDREFIGAKLVPEGLLAADRVEALLREQHAEIARLREERDSLAPSADPVYEPPPVCRSCNGDGWYVGHEDECHETGDCHCSGVQIPCEMCGGTGVPS